MTVRRVSVSEVVTLNTYAGEEMAVTQTDGRRGEPTEAR
ncbi:hypothetical protein ATJ97_2888 [Georgenia soli]|uniref:Uncharacterized protein n=1 Tax=Georgenia soli TaxID=638953 RepID=A0A2A9ENK3_9MICO|nr:hypothetical protein ATJ97_2888 [Georgenia soli]